MMNSLKLLLVGCGKMGGAVLHGSLKKGLAAQNVRIVEKSAELRADLQAKGLSVSENAGDFHDFSPDIVFIAVKPFAVGDVLNDCRFFTDKGATVLSIAAGKRVGFYEKILGAHTAVIRAMPNTPALIGKGMTAAFANAFVSEKTRLTAQTFLEGFGKFAWVDDESLIDSVTAVSGSGPAYLFYFTETLARAALKAGLPEELCMTFAKQTVCGAAALMETAADSPAVLRRNVTTPNGTTAAALDVLAGENGLQALMDKAVDAAKQRSVELAQ